MFEENLGAQPNNFYDGSECEFHLIDNDLADDDLYLDPNTNTIEFQSDPDYESESGSRYWYRDDGVFRQSDHWGTDIGDCSWYLNDYRDSSWDFEPYGFTPNVDENQIPIGFAKWSDFKLANPVCIYLYSDLGDCIDCIHMEPDFISFSDITNGSMYINNDEYKIIYDDENKEWSCIPADYNLTYDHECIN